MHTLNHHDAEQLRRENAEASRLRELFALINENEDLSRQVRKIEHRHEQHVAQKTREAELERRLEMRERAARAYGKPLPAPQAGERRPTTTSRPVRGSVLTIRSSTPPGRPVSPHREDILELRAARRDAARDRARAAGLAPPSPLPPLDREALAERARQLYGGVGPRTQQDNRCSMNVIY